MGENYPQEFLREGTEIQTGDAVPAPSEFFPVHIRAPPTINQAVQGRPLTRMYRRDFLRDPLGHRHEIRTAHHDNTSALQQAGEDTDPTKSPKAEESLEHDSEIPDYSSSDYGSSDY